MFGQYSQLVVAEAETQQKQYQYQNKRLVIKKYK